MMAKNGVLLVEGENDANVLGDLFEINDIQESFVIHVASNDVGVFKVLGNNLKSGSFESRDSVAFDINRIGVVVDSNGSTGKRVTAFNKVLRNYGYTPKDITPDGIIVMGDDSKEIKRVGMWVMPDNSRAGMLESFFRQFIPSEDALLPHVETFIDDLPKHEFKASKPHEKAVVRTWLACQEKSEALMGAFLKKTNNGLNIHNDLAEKFVDWIKRLFTEPNGGKND